MNALSRKYANRKSLIRNLATSLVLYEQITTTEAKAKITKEIVEKILSQAKQETLASRRKLLEILFDENATKKVIEVLIPRYKDIKSGFIKSYRLGNRLGDGAQMMMLSLVKVKTPEIKASEIKEGKEGKDGIKETSDAKVKNDTSTKVSRKNGKANIDK